MKNGGQQKRLDKALTSDQLYTVFGLQCATDQVFSLLLISFL